MPIHIAAVYNSIGALQIILKQGQGNIDEEDILGRSPLFYAIREVRRHQNFRLITMLLQNGADINKEDLTGESIANLLNKDENAALKSTIFSIAKRLKSKEYVEEESDSDEEDRESPKKFYLLIDETHNNFDPTSMATDI